MSSKKELSLKENFSWNFIGSLIHSISSFLILVVLAKLGDPIIVGLYSIGLALTEPVSQLTDMQLRQIQATDTKEASFKYSDYLGFRMISSVVMLLIILLILIFNSYTFEKALIIILIGIRRMIFSYSDLVFGQLQQRERMDFIGKSQSFRGISSVIIVGLALYITKSLIITLIILNISWLYLLVYYDKKNLKIFLNDLKPSFYFDKIKKLFFLSLPLGIVLMFISLNTNLPRIVTEKILGEEMLGYFSAIAYLIVVGNTFVRAIGQAVAPRLAKLYRGKNIVEFKKIMKYLLVIGLLTGIVGVLVSVFLGEFILTLIYDQSYAAYNHVLILVMISGIFSYLRTFLGYGLTSMRYFKIQPYINLFSFIVILISSINLIPKLNIEGAVITIIIGAFVQFISYSIVILYRLNQK